MEGWGEKRNKRQFNFSSNNGGRAKSCSCTPSMEGLRQHEDYSRDLAYNLNIQSYVLAAEAGADGHTCERTLREVADGMGVLRSPRWSRSQFK